MLIIEDGRIRNSDDADLADEIIKARKKGPWEVIDLLVKSWVNRSPEEVKAIKVDITDKKEVMVDKKFGSTLGGKDFERRFTLIFPTALQSLIRTQYKSEELQFNKEFYTEFGKRYPGFRIAEKI